MADRKVFIVVAALFAFFTCAHMVMKEAVSSPFNDFRNYWLNAQLLNEGYNAWQDMPRVEERRNELIAAHDMVITGPPLHSPGFFVLFRPFSVLPPRAAALLWLACGLAAAAAGLAVFLRRFGMFRPRELLLSGLFLVFSFWPMTEQVHDGQPNLFILALLCCVLCAFEGGYFFLAGLLFGFTVQLREYLAVAALFFLLTRNWRALAGFVSGVLVLKLCAALMFGMRAEPSYWQSLTAMFAGKVFPLVANISFQASLWRFLAPVTGSFLPGAVFVACMAAFAFLAWKRARGKGDGTRGFLAFIVLAVIASPWVHESHLIILLPAFLLALPMMRDAKPVTVGLFAAVYLLMGLKYSLNSFPVFFTGLPAVCSMGKTAGLILLFFLWHGLTARGDAHG